MKHQEPWKVAVFILSFMMAVCGCGSDSTSSDSSSNGDSSNGTQGDVMPGTDDGDSAIEGYLCQSSNCPSPAVCCGNVCRDIMTNARHCGACNHACATNETCEDGECVASMFLSCSPGETACDGKCVTVVNNNENCGACGNRCADDEVCNGRTCEKTCGISLSQCGDRCIDTVTDNENCGACDHACEANAFCELGACKTTCADEKHVVCDHQCVDLTTRADNCGACGTPCPDTAYCAGGECVETCENAEQTVCKHVCVDTQTDSSNCGACGQVCPDTAYCADGECIETCENAEQTICDHVCVDTQTDSSNCGECGNLCVSGQLCDNGVCVCPESDPYCDHQKPTCAESETLCGLDCIDTQRDTRHCGECGHACDEGLLCVNGLCESCTGGKGVCADGECHDLQSDASNCGACGSSCPPNVACIAGKCAQCMENYTDCNGDPSDGCEKTTADCVCVTGETQECYPGPATTRGVGACKAGTTTCINGHWGPCEGLVLPNYQIKCDPSNPNADLDCNGIPDGTGDADHDGYTLCGGDCCDTKEMCNISNPELINPGMLEVVGNGFDDNCNGVVDEVPATCNASYTQGQNLSTSDSRNSAAIQFARALDLCTTVSDNQAYGLVSATVQSLKADTLGNTEFSFAINVLPRLSNTVSGKTYSINPQKGSTFAAISTGRIASTGLTFDRFFIQGGTIPSKYLSAHGGQLQSAPGCGTATTNINDSVMLQLKIRAPKNATGFKFDFRFFSYEYPKYICTEYNDFFLALLDSTAKGIPTDSNIAFDKVGNPVSINNAFFTSCEPMPCSSHCPAIYTKGCVSGKCTTAYGACPDGVNDLYAFNEDGNGGATAWLTTQAPIVGGETFTLTFYIWDTGDSSYDSAAILDNFQWITNQSVIVSTDFSDNRT